jgi:hypothetical protein
MISRGDVVVIDHLEKPSQNERSSCFRRSQTRFYADHREDRAKQEKGV